MAAWAVVAVLAVVVVVRLVGERGPEPAPVAVRTATGAATAPSGRAIRPVLYVHVAGAVRRPGLYRVADGARVAAAVHRAGGPTRAADLTGVNLAATLEDGQQVVVPARGGGGSPSADAQATVSLGSATAEQLEELDGIGPTLAERIVEQRQASGGFGSVEQLGEVEGIGEKRLEALKEALTP